MGMTSLWRIAYENRYVTHLLLIFYSQLIMLSFSIRLVHVIVILPSEISVESYMFYYPKIRRSFICDSYPLVHTRLETCG